MYPKILSQLSRASVSHGSTRYSALWQTKPMAEENKVEQTLSHARELRREAAELIKTV